MEQLTKWQVIFNPHAGCGKARRDKRHIITLLNNSGLQFIMHQSDYAGHALELAKQLAASNYTHFIVAGGDGTLNEVVNGIFQGKSHTISKIVVGMIPVGTGNDWIRTFGIPDDYQKAIEIIKEGKTVIQDVGLITRRELAGIEKRYFTNIAGFGFDAMVASYANALKNRGISGIRVYIQSFLKSYLKYKEADTLIIIDDQRIKVNLFSISVGIGKYNGGGMMQVPDANPVEGLFHITLIRKMSLLGIIQNFRKLYSGSFLSDRRVSSHKGKHVSIKAQTSLLGEADGENLGKGHFNLQLIPHQLKVVYGGNLFPENPKSL